MGSCAAQAGLELSVQPRKDYLEFLVLWPPPSAMDLQVCTASPGYEVLGIKPGASCVLLKTLPAQIHRLAQHIITLLLFASQNTVSKE